MMMMNKTKFTNDFSKEVFEMTYRFGEETIDDLHRRVAVNLAGVEKDKEKWEEKFADILSEFKFIPGGRILSNAGLDFKGTTYINCFVDGFIGEDQDSMDSIMDALKRQANILKSEGGYGFCSDVLRPRGGFVEGIGTSTPGAVEMLSMWDMQSTVITKGSGAEIKDKRAKKKIRKGAQMVTMSVWHPDVVEFITAKQQKGRLTKFNMSVMITDAFMDAVKNHEPWNLEFPDFDFGRKLEESITQGELLLNNFKQTYERTWDGDLATWKKRGQPTKIYKTFKDANELWDLIMQSTYTRNEPGVLFIDRINHFNNLWYNEYINATNPCGEQALPVGGVCLLGSLNLTQFVKGKNWDYDKLGEVIPTAVRLMDNVNDITHVPLDVQRQNLQNKRRIGLGIMGYGSALLMMNQKYGSKRALKLTDELMEFIANTAYQASALIAKEKGKFPVFNEKYLEGNFIANLSDETKALILEHGTRNSHLLSIQPTGNTSVFANNVSGGLEPVFMFEYKRAAIIPYPPSGLVLPTNIDWVDKKFDKFSGHLSSIDGLTTTQWQWIKEGDENLLQCTFESEVYKMDSNRGLMKEATVTDYGVLNLQNRGKWDVNADWATDTRSLKISEHVDTMTVFAKWIDSSMSKTINLPKDFAYDEFKNVYENLYDSGVIKGGTSYREGTMTAVLYDKDKDSDERNGVHIIKTTAPKRPKVLKCDVHHITAKGKRWVIFVGLLSGEPYEVFALRSRYITIPERINKGSLTRVKRGVYKFETPDGLILEDITELFEKDEEEALTRTISWGLRHGASIEYGVDGLNKSEGTIVSFNKAIARALKRYVSESKMPEDSRCPECTQHALAYIEGCLKCTNCAWSKCD